MLVQLAVNELASNEILIAQLEEGKTSFEAEKGGIKQSLADQKAQLETLSVTPLEFHQLASTFVDSPPIPGPDLLLFGEDAGTSTVGASEDIPRLLPPTEVRSTNVVQIFCY